MSPTIAQLAILERFDWTSSCGQTQITFYVTELWAAVGRAEIESETVLTPVLAEFARQIIAAQFDPDDLRLCQEMSARRADEGVLGVLDPRGEVILVDGSHRYVTRYLRGLSLIEITLVPWSAAFGRFARLRGKPL